MEMVSSSEIDHVHVSFMVAGYTEFVPDHLFSTVGSTEDTFTMHEHEHEHEHELRSICDQCATTCIVDGEQSVHLTRYPRSQIF